MRSGVGRDQLRERLEQVGIALIGARERIPRAATSRARQIAADVLRPVTVDSAPAQETTVGPGAASISDSLTAGDAPPTVGCRPGDIVEGTVTSILTYGAFVQISPGVGGLIHISELAQHYVENPREVVAEGDTVEVLVLDAAPSQRKLSLSLRRAAVPDDDLVVAESPAPSAPTMFFPKQPTKSAPTSRVSPTKTEAPRIDTGIPGWRRVGTEQTLEYLTAAQLEAIHWQIVDEFAQQNDPIGGGVRTLALLESTALRPHTSLAGIAKYPTAAMAGAALFHSVVHNHAFHDGNKRTALVALIAFLDTNGWLLQAEENELYAYVLRVAQHKICEDYDPSESTGADRETLAIAEWLHERLRRVQKGEFVIQWRVLQRLLANYGCEFKMAHRGNRMDITRDGKRSQIQYTGDGMDVARNTIHKIRHDLALDETHGVDSQAFYRGHARVPEFINRYRKILTRLAEYDRQQGQSHADDGGTS